MKKVINITLGSIVFAIEQDAYDALAVYLEQIKSNLTDSDDAKEVVGDIEGAIAEKFVAYKRSEKFAVTAADVAGVISEMGSPADFNDGEVVTKKPEDEASAAKPTTTETKKRLYRDMDNSIIAGVASGLARYFDIDPVLVRLIFVISVFFNGLGILAYIVLWLVVPKAETTADKYAMRGEGVTLKEISERVKKNLQSLDEADFQTTKGVWEKLRGLLDTVFHALGSVARFVLTIARYVVGVALVVGGALGIAGMFSVYSVILLSDQVFFPTEVQVALETLQGNTLGIVAMGSSFILMAIPLLVFIIAGASLLAKRSFFTVQKVVTLAVIWIVFAVLAGTTSVLQVEQVMQKIGPVEGRFDESSFEVQWEEGVLQGNEDEFIFRYEGQGTTTESDPENVTLYDNEIEALPEATTTTTAEL